MQIIISGYGKMGREVESIALSRGHEILHTLDRPEDWDKLPEFVPSRPTVIDFSQPDVVMENILSCFSHRLPMVVGTTGWNHELHGLAERCRSEKHSLFTASNFSLGVNLFFAVNKYLASLMDAQDDFQVSLSETHHIHKLDKPSGTAISLAGQLISNLRRKKDWTLENDAPDDQLKIECIRQGEVFGDHRILYESDSDRIEISHSAKNRRGFALGAVMAAEWLQGKTGYFGMEDLLGL